MGNQSVTSGTGKPICDAVVREVFVDLKNGQVGAISSLSASYTVSSLDAYTLLLAPHSTFHSLPA